MDHRYLIAVTLPADDRDKLNALYKSVTGEDLTIDTMHVSLEFPFFLRHSREDEFKARLRDIYLTTFPVECVRLGMFHQKEKKMLYMKLQPAERFVELHETIRREMSEYYLLDTAIYDNGVVPMYEPHLSLKYDMQYTEDVVKKLEETLRGFTFPAENVSFYKELEKGVWELV